MLNPHRGIRFLDLKIAVYRIVNIKHATVLFHMHQKKKETLEFFLFLLQPEPRLHVCACVRVGLNA